MIKYNYKNDGLIQFIESHGEGVQTNGFIRNKDEIKSLINSGVEIAPYVEPVKTLSDIREERDAFLAKNVDIYNPLRWDELSANQKANVKAYRQALLDITKQDPTNVTWPELPAI